MLPGVQFTLQEGTVWARSEERNICTLHRTEPGLRSPSVSRSPHSGELARLVAGKCRYGSLRVLRNVVAACLRTNSVEVLYAYLASLSITYGIRSRTREHQSSFFIPDEQAASHSGTSLTPVRNDDRDQVQKRPLLDADHIQ